MVSTLPEISLVHADRATIECPRWHRHKAPHMNTRLQILRAIKANDGRYTFRPRGTDLDSIREFQVIASAVTDLNAEGMIDTVLPHVSSRYPGQLTDSIVAEGLSEEAEEFLEEHE